MAAGVSGGSVGGGWSVGGDGCVSGGTDLGLPCRQPFPGRLDLQLTRAGHRIASLILKRFSTDHRLPTLAHRLAYSLVLAGGRPRSRADVGWYSEDAPCDTPTAAGTMISRGESLGLR